MAPRLRPLRQEHLDAFGELLPHVFFGDLTAWLVRACLADPDAGPEATWRRILTEFERNDETGDTDIKELLYASFLEHLASPGDDDT